MVKQHDKIQAILGLCARNSGHDRMYEQLETELESFSHNRCSWEALIRHAEYQGMAPLLYKHISAVDFTLPDGQHRILRSLYQRCRLANRIRNRVAADIITTFQQRETDALLIKGIALANTIYESPELRPMRDIDLLVQERNLETAADALAKQGFIQEEDHDIPHDYYHLPPMQKAVDGLPISIEVHHRLLPPHPDYPMWSFTSFQDALFPFRIDDTKATTLNSEDNLHYLYLHGIRAPLTYEPFRLIHIADLVSLTESRFADIDWDKVTSDFPRCLSVLSRLHFITPWQDFVVNGLELEISERPGKPGHPYRGWPLFKIKKTPAAGLPELLKETVLPPQWWQQIYYGQSNGLHYLKTRWFDHPRTIWRWIKTYVRARLERT